MTVAKLKKCLQDLGCDSFGQKVELQDRLKEKLREIGNSNEHTLTFGVEVTTPSTRPSIPPTDTRFKFNLQLPNAKSDDDEMIIEKVIPLPSARKNPFVLDEDEFFDAEGKAMWECDQPESATLLGQSGGEPSSSTAQRNSGSENEGEPDEIKQTVGIASSPMAVKKHSSPLRLNIKVPPPGMVPPVSSNYSQSSGRVQGSTAKPKEKEKKKPQNSQQMLYSKTSPSTYCAPDTSESEMIAPKPRHIRTPIDVVQAILGRNPRARRRAAPAHWGFSASPGPYQELRGMGSAFHAPRARFPNPELARPAPVRPDPPPQSQGTSVGGLSGPVPQASKPSSLPSQYTHFPEYEDAVASRKRNIENTWHPPEEELEPPASRSSYTEIMPFAKRQRGYVPSPMPESPLKAAPAGLQVPWGNSSTSRKLPTNLGAQSRSLLSSATLSRFGPRSKAFATPQVEETPSHDVSFSIGRSVTASRSSRISQRGVAPAVSGAIAARILQALQTTSEVPRLQHISHHSTGRNTSDQSTFSNKSHPSKFNMQHSKQNTSPFSKGPVHQVGLPFAQKSPQVSEPKSQSPSPRNTPGIAPSLTMYRAEPSPLNGSNKFTPNTTKALQFSTPGSFDGTQKSLGAKSVLSAEKKQPGNEEPDKIPGVMGSEFCFSVPKMVETDESVAMEEISEDSSKQQPKFFFSPAGTRKRGSLTGKTFQKPVSNQTISNQEQAVQPQPKEDSKKKSPAAAPSSSEPVSLWELFKPKAGEWNCEACRALNSQDKTKCVCCETPKAGVDTSTKSDPTSKPAPSGAITAGGFSFGATPAVAASSAVGFGSQGFTFSAAPSTNSSTEGMSGGFSFGAPASQTQTSTTVNLQKPTQADASSKNQPGGFSFGGVTALPLPEGAATGFGFGKPDPVKEEKAAAPASNFSLDNSKLTTPFSAPSSNQSNSTKGTTFSFGQASQFEQAAKNESAESQAAPVISFGASRPLQTSGDSTNGVGAQSSFPTSVPNQVKPVAEPANAPPVFLFGGPSSGSAFGGSQVSSAPQTEALPKNAFFGFGNATKPASTDLSLGTSTKKTASPSQNEAPTKRNRSRDEEDNETQKQPPQTAFQFSGSSGGGFSFGASNPLSSGDSKPASSAAFTFGSGNQQASAPAPAAQVPALPAPTSTPAAAFTFGSAAPTNTSTENKPAFAFGSSAPPASNAPAESKTFAFGTTGSASGLNAPTNATASSFTFGSSNSLSAATAKPASFPSVGTGISTMPAFGSAASGFGSSSSGFPFGSAAPSTPAFGMNNSTTAPDSAGMDTEDNAATNGNAQAAMTFGAPMVAPASSFQFGSAAPASAFGFGAAAAAPTAPLFGAAPAQSTFAFGSPQPTPAGAAPAFGFGGAAAPASSATPAFGSPPPAGGGFAIGATAVKGRKIVRAKRPGHK